MREVLLVSPFVTMRKPRLRKVKPCAHREELGLESGIGRLQESPMMAFPDCPVPSDHGSVELGVLGGR